MGQPAVPSVMRPPGLRRPSAKASCTTCSATLSLTLPPGFSISAFARICSTRRASSVPAIKECAADRRCGALSRPSHSHRTQQSCLYQDSAAQRV